jgi:hypothetical protein
MIVVGFAGNGSKTDNNHAATSHEYIPNAWAWAAVSLEYVDWLGVLQRIHHQRTWAKHRSSELV